MNESHIKVTLRQLDNKFLDYHTYLDGQLWPKDENEKNKKSQKLPS